MTISTVPWQRLLRPQLLVLYSVIFLADTIGGYVLPLFPLLARELGASLTVIGGLVAFNGATQVIVAVPIGALSDRVGRRRLISAGLLCYALAALILAVARMPFLLIAAQVLFGVGIVCIFALGAAMAGDYSAPEERGMTMGCLTTAMGLGFATGPLLGGYMAGTIGMQASLVPMAALAIACAGLAWFHLVDVNVSGGPRAGNPLRSLRLLARSRLILLAALANFLFSPIFVGLMITLVPVQAGVLGFSAMAIGSLFSLRALASTATRLPTGFISTPAWSHRLMLIGLMLSGVAVLLLAQRTSYAAYSLALVLEGISYGMFLTAGQAFVTQHAGPTVRGAALGAYGMAGGISSALGPLVLGALADAIGVGTVFVLVGVITVIGAGALAAGFHRAMRTES